MKKYHISRIFLISLGCILGSGVIYATINYSELFPNGSTVVQSQTNGWTTPLSGASKEIMTPEGCKKITSSLGYSYHIPTGSTAEWTSFRDNLPSGVSITSCLGNGYPGCNTNDIVLGNGQIWSACNLGTNTSGFTAASYGNFYQGGRNVPGWIAGWNTNNWGLGGQGPCASGYHVPTSTEWTNAYSYFGNNTSNLRNGLVIPYAGCISTMGLSCNQTGIVFAMRSSSNLPGVVFNSGIGYAMNLNSFFNTAAMSVRCIKDAPPPPVNATCSTTANICTAGTPSGYVAGSCGGNATWTCNGSNGGTNASCSIANASCNYTKAGACSKIVMAPDLSYLTIYPVVGYNGASEFCYARCNLNGGIYGGTTSGNACSLYWSNAAGHDCSRAMPMYGPGVYTALSFSMYISKSGSNLVINSAGTNPKFLWGITGPLNFCYGNNGDTYLPQ